MNFLDKKEEIPKKGLESLNKALKTYLKLNGGWSYFALAQWSSFT